MATLALSVLPLAAILGLIIFILANGVGAGLEIGLPDLAGQRWSPLQGRFGLLPLFAGTLAVMLLALVLATPVALAAAGYLALFASGPMRATANALIGLLGGIPSVVIGLWAMTWIVPQFGNSWLSASCVLALMIAPTIALLSGAALRLVPRDLLETTRTLGLSDDVAALTAFHHARFGISGAIVLGASRALGEAVAVSMVAGNVSSWPEFLRPIATLTTTLIVELEGAAGLHRDSLYLLAGIVVVAVSVLSVLGRAAQRKAGG